MGAKEIVYSLNRDKPPCYGCTREIKCPGCHDQCKDFQDWKALGDAAKRAQREYNNKPFHPFT